MRHGILGAIRAVVVLVLLVGGWAEAGTLYQVTDLGTVPGGTASLAFGINASGQVVGEVSTANQPNAFLYTGGPLQDLGTPSQESGANAINASGQVVGGFVTAIGTRFLYSGRWQDLGTLPGFTNSNAFAINDAGQIAGDALGTGGGIHAFLYSGGQFRDLGTLPGGTDSNARGINNAGQVVGFASSHEFLYSGGALQDLGLSTASWAASPSPSTTRARSSALSLALSLVAGSVTHSCTAGGSSGTWGPSPASRAAPPSPSTTRARSSAILSTPSQDHLMPSCTIMKHCMISTH